MTAAPDHWDVLRRRWNAMRPPQRPHPDAVARMVALAGGRRTRVMLLGVTPELAAAFDRVVAVDKSAAMIRHLWPGDAPGRLAIEADWLTLDGSLGRFGAVVGDGSLNAVAYPGDVALLLRQVGDHLDRDGRFVCRVYLRPEVPWPWEELVSPPEAGAGFHAFRWKVAMRLAADAGASVAVARIHAEFERRFPDRDALARLSGWNRAEIDTIDSYRNSDAVYCFPTAAELLSLLPRHLRFEAFEASGSYELADCCPVLVCARD